MRICAPLIVKNEAAVIEDCLVSIRPHVDEIVVMDTGSTDETIRLASRHADKVIRSKRFDAATSRDDFHFADARNEVLDQCSGDWCLSVDADELVAASRLREWLGGHEGLCSEVWRFENQSRMRVPRLFKRDGVRWINRYHDVPDVFRKHPASAAPKEIVTLTANPKAERSDLFKRNTVLLKKQLMEEGKIGFTAWQIADNYRAAGLSNYGEAIGYYELVLTVLAPNDAATRPYLLYCLADCYKQLGVIHKAFVYAVQLVELAPQCVESHVMMGDLMMNQNCRERAADFYRTALALTVDPKPLHPKGDWDLNRSDIEAALARCNS